MAQQLEVLGRPFGMERGQQAHGLGNHPTVLEPDQVAPIEVVSPADDDLDPQAIQVVRGHGGVGQRGPGGIKDQELLGLSPRDRQRHDPVRGRAKRNRGVQVTAPPAGHAVVGARVGIVERLERPPLGGDLARHVPVRQDIGPEGEEVRCAGEPAGHADQGDLVGPTAPHRKASTSRGVRFRGASSVPKFSREDDLDLALTPVYQLVHQGRHADLGGDHPQSTRTEMMLEIRDHADSRPRSPDRRNDTAWPAAIEPDRQLVQGLIGRGVIGLAPIPEASRDRREKDREPERLGVQKSCNVQCSVELRVEHAIKRIQGLVADQLVADEPRPVNQPDGFTEESPPAVHDDAQAGKIADIDSGILDPRAGGP